MLFTRDILHCLFGLGGGSLRSYRWKYKLGFVAGDPMSHGEIDELEAFLSLPLPVSYRAYLSIAGNRRTPGGTRSFATSDLHGEHLRSLRSRAAALIHATGQSLALPDRAVFFCEHEGYLCFYFIADHTADNPDVYSYCEGDLEFKKTGERLANWLGGW